MKVILMNKNTEILIAEYNTNLNVFDKIYEIINIDYAPLILNSYYKLDNDKLLLLKRLSEWFKGRGIPSWRDKLDLLLYRLNIENASELLNKAFGLSLSDQYWLKPYDMDIKYDDINFFDHNFDYSEFLEASLSLNNEFINNENSLKSPNNTTDGMLKKAWIIEDGVRYLVKGGYKNDNLQPFNEVLASMICARLGFNHVPYTLDIYKNMVVSKCPRFITKDTELITAYQIKNNMKRYDNIEDYEAYIQVLEDNGIEKARIELENMYILDFLIMNEDRHMNNFGIIRDVNTLKWISVAPIFDNGMALNIEIYNEKEVNIKGYGRLFYEINPFDEIIKVVKNINRIDISKLDGVVEDFDKLLHQYQNITKISDIKINALCILLQRQINKLKKFQEDFTEA